MENLLQTLMSDSLVLFTKLHNFHWNIKGLEFLKIHEKTEELYNHFSENYDFIAERLLQRGAKPITNLRQILELAKIQEDSNSDFTPQYVFTSIAKDFTYLKEQYSVLANLSENDVTTKSFAESQIAFFEKELWMIQATLA